MWLRVGLIAVLASFYVVSSAQDTLPRFSVENRGRDRIVVSWTNPYGEKIRQLSIQRSYDSLRNFKTLLTLPDPTVPQNGYVDAKASNDHMFYRLYILLDSGRYLFSKTRRPGPPQLAATPRATDTVVKKGIIPLEQVAVVEKHVERIIFIKRRDTLLGGIPESALKHFRDSVHFNTKDTIFMKTTDTLVVKNFIPREFYRPSKFVFTEKDGNIRIALPGAGTHKYALKFFEEDESELFEVKNIEDTLVILDKANFIHAGWFSFELYEDGKLKERHKLYVPKEF